MSRPHGLDQPDWQIHKAQERVKQQKALVRRGIVQGTPTQAAEDALREREQALLRVKEQHQHARASAVRRKMCDRRSH
jgi:hypothetical protein